MAQYCKITSFGILPLVQCIVFISAYFTVVVDNDELVKSNLIYDCLRLEHCWCRLWGHFLEHLYHQHFRLILLEFLRHQSHALGHDDADGDEMPAYRECRMY